MSDRNPHADGQGCLRNALCMRPIMNPCLRMRNFGKLNLIDAATSHAHESASVNAPQDRRLILPCRVMTKYLRRCRHMLCSRLHDLLPELPRGVH